VNPIKPQKIKCIVFDFGFTLSPDHYFNIAPADFPQWHEVIQNHIFANPFIIDPWMRGELTSRDIAAILTQYIPMDANAILASMEKGCEQLEFNPAVWEFAAAQKNAGRKTALVTDNMDVFTQVVVPAHHLERLFDVIINSSDHHETRKDLLWPIAFERLGGGTGYGNSLLIEDGEEAPSLFRSLGGWAYQYSTDDHFSEWLASIPWSKNG
jgi:FMN phosphatase YigB (HAD superfamily)